MNEAIPINDGGGLMDNVGLIDSLIVDCNNLLKHLICGNYVAFSGLVVQMVQKLTNLQNGIKSDNESLQKQITELSVEVNRLANLTYNSEKGANDANP